MKTLTHIRGLLARQREASRDGIQFMTDAEWAEYCSIEREIDALLASLSVAQPEQRALRAA